MFICSFAIHVLWWKTKMPLRSTAALLSVFFGVLLIALLAYGIWVPALVIAQLPQVFSFILLYSSGSLCYIILYSAIEQESPTLAIVDFINAQGNSGRDIHALNISFNASAEIKSRLTLMEQTGWLAFDGLSWSLTNKGRKIACIFESAATIFGLNKGG
jgi:hypothetical protein